MRIVQLLIALFVMANVFGQRVDNAKVNLGKVKEWNNPIVEFAYTNTSGKSQLFLPIAYSKDTRVDFGKNKLAPGESTTIKVQYFTESFGKFSTQVPVYVSTSNTPISLQVTGNIQSFHADALTICPRIDNTELQLGKNFKHGILVIDGNTKEPVTHFEIELKTKSSKEVIFSKKSGVSITREKPDWYTLSVDKEGYGIQDARVYVNRHSPMTIIELFKEEDDVLVSTKDNSEDEDLYRDPPGRDVAEEKEVDEEQEQERGKEQEVEEVEQDEPVVVVERVPAKDTSDFTEDGTLSRDKYAFNNIIFLIDVSGSMNRPEKMPLLKYSMDQMIDILRPEDRVSIVTYSSSAKTLIADVSGADKQTLHDVVATLKAKGQSFGSEGLAMAYELAEESFIAGGNNEVILASDGGFNSKNFKESKVFRQAVIQHRTNQIKISTIGFGKAPVPLQFMETLAKRGSGDFIQIKSMEEARTILIQNIMRHSYRR